MKSLDDLDLARLDPSGMHLRIAGLGADATQAWEAAARLAWKPRPVPRAVLVAGMGGSAIAADVLRDYAEDELAFPVHVVRDYALPGWAGPDCLLVASSYSGNTEETVSCYLDARRRGVPRVALCSGGRLKQLADEDGIDWAGYPPGYPPRAAFGWSFFTLLGAFVKMGFLGARDREVAAAVLRLQNAAEAYGPGAPEALNRAKRLAREFADGLPVLYAPSKRLSAVAMRWRTQVNENGKALLHTALLPELNHNEIVGWERPYPGLAASRVVAFRDRGDHPRVALRLDITKRLLEQAGGRVEVLESEGETLLERLLSLLVLGDWVSLYLGFMFGVDPTPVTKIDHLKSELEQAGASA